MFFRILLCDELLFLDGKIFPMDSLGGFLRLFFSSASLKFFFFLDLVVKIFLHPLFINAGKLFSNVYFSLKFMQLANVFHLFR